MNSHSDNLFPIRGFNLIEASAGTGKTYTIQNLYLRLIAGWHDSAAGQLKHLPAESILVMTYTTAATEELKARIRKILAQAEQYLVNPSALSKDDSERLSGLLAESLAQAGPGPVRQRIRNALLVFDDAAIYTIHGFCQRLLTQYAFESGILFHTEIRTDSDQMIRDLLNDFIRHFCYPETEPLYAALHKGVSLTGKKQFSLTRDLISRPYLKIIGGEDLDLPAVGRKIETVLGRLKQEYSLSGLPPEPVALCSDAKIPDLGGWAAESRMGETSAEVLNYLLELNRSLSALAETPEDDPDSRRKVAAAMNSRFVRLCRDLEQSVRQYRALIPYYGACWVRDRLEAAKQRENFQTYDDLLIRVRNAVHEAGNPLLAAVRQQYQAAVVDEFQDTDPVQYDIFRRIFGYPDGNRLLFFVGDPKQAIYGFRGGDIATYRSARDFIRTCGSEYSLRRNYRSAEKLLESVNDLFEKCPHNRPGGETVFADDAIPFTRVSAGKKSPGLLAPDGGEDPCPFKFCWIAPPPPAETGPETERKKMTLDAMTDHAVRACAEDIVHLLRSGWRNPETGVALQPGDIAVLVLDNAEAVRMRRELQKRQVPCVIPRAENVFFSAAAKALETVLRAVSEPSDTRLVSEAMLTPLLGFSLDQLIRIHAGISSAGADAELTAVQEQLNELLILWRQHSFLVMFQELLRRFEVRGRLLNRPDGERLLTDLLHLRELIHQNAAGNGLSIDGVLSWLTGRINAPKFGSIPEEQETMMETDLAAVVINTVHSSKGLEYPVVMLPAMFKREYRCDPDFSGCCHNADGELFLALIPTEEIREKAARENKQELMRLLYVALTRAKYSCYLYWGLIQGKKSDELHDQTALDWLFPEISAHEFSRLSPAVSQLERCEKRILPTDRIGCTVWSPEEKNPEQLIFRPWRGTLDPDYHYTSFSALAGGAGGMDGRDCDCDDSDNRIETPVGIFRIPAGTQTGNAWHDIMEKIDFTAFDPQQDRDFIERKMQLFGVLPASLSPAVRKEYVDLTADMIAQLLNTPLDNAFGERFSLKEIPFRERVSELRFNYRFRGAFRTGRIIRTIADYVETVFGQTETDIAIRDFFLSGGGLNGAVDLLFRRNGKLYVADWKSNRINGLPEGFSPDGITREMAAHTYYLQYLIYTVAVMKYLSLHLGHPVTEADYGHWFGGVYYFFMRGVDASKPGQGVFYQRPPFALIRELDRLIG